MSKSIKHLRRFVATLALAMPALPAAAADATLSPGDLQAVMELLMSRSCRAQIAPMLESIRKQLPENISLNNAEGAICTCAAGETIKGSRAQEIFSRPFSVLKDKAKNPDVEPYLKAKYAASLLRCVGNQIDTAIDSAPPVLSPSSEAAPKPVPPTDAGHPEAPAIADRFPDITLTRENLAVEVTRCIPQIRADSPAISEQVATFPNSNVVLLSHVDSSRRFVLNQHLALCLSSSANGYPIFAAESFLDTANPQGVPADVSNAWYRELGRLIALKGAARVAYHFPNGNAFAARYWVDSAGDHRIHYSMSFMNKGSWENESFDAKFSHPDMTSVSDTKRAGKSIKVFPLGHRFRPGIRQPAPINKPSGRIA